MQDNPFAPPESDIDGPPGSGSGEGYHVEGELLVMEIHGPPLPDRCVKCNAPSTHRFAKPLQWIPRWVPLTILICWPAYFAALLMTRKTGKVNVGLCDEHHQRHRVFQTAGAVLLVAGLAGIFGGLFAEMLVVLGIGMVALFAGILVMLPARVIWPTFMDDEVGHYKGASPAFLDSL